MGQHPVDLTAILPGGRLSMIQHHAIGFCHEKIMFFYRGFHKWGLFMLFLSWRPQMGGSLKIGAL